MDESLIFHVAYLGTDQPSLNLNFSKNANMVVAQYYQVSHNRSDTNSNANSRCKLASLQQQRNAGTCPVIHLCHIFAQVCSDMAQVLKVFACSQLLLMLLLLS